MIKNVIKRDGEVVAFDIKKIENAIMKAIKATQTNLEIPYNKEFLVRESALFIKLNYNVLNETACVEDIQNAIEKILMAYYPDVAKAFILYREQRKQIRNITQKSINIVDDYLEQIDWRVKENSNQGFSLQGLNNFISSKISSEYWLKKIYPENICEAHLNGDMHIHDLNLLSIYCVGWDLEDLLREGFKGVSGCVESAPAKHFRTALGQLVNFFYTLQGEAAGAQAVSSIDTYLAPFIWYDGLLYEEVKQAMQEFIFNMNVPTRVGFQTPFTNITLDLKCPKHMAETPVIIGGVPQNRVYRHFQSEMNMFNKAFAEVMMEGDNKGRVFTFPIPTYNITKDFDWGNKEFEPIWKMTGKYGIPYFANFVTSDMNIDDTRSMCCRLRLDTKEIRKRGGGLFGANPLTGSLGVVTINLPRIALKADKDIKKFYKYLDEAIDLAKESLIIKRKTLEKMTEGGLYPYTSFYLRDVKAKTGKYWTNHFSTIGIIGMNEALLNLVGVNIGEDIGLAEEIVSNIAEKIQYIQEETGDLFNLEATPAEGTSYRLAMLDKKEYGDKCNFAGTGDVPFYTNSTHLPVNYTDDLFEALELQDELQTKYTGGTVLHGFVGEEIQNPNTVKILVKKITDNFKLPYFTLTPTFSVCYTHGYIAGEHKECPECGGETEVYSRVVGYLRPVNRWNDGKREEFGMRKEYQVKE